MRKVRKVIEEVRERFSGEQDARARRGAGKSRGISANSNQLEGTIICIYEEADKKTMVREQDILLKFC